MKEISRRNLLQGIVTTAAVNVLGAPEILAAPQIIKNLDGGKPRTIALIGDPSHNADALRVSLNRIFKELDLPIDYTTNYYNLSAEMLKPYQIFLGFRDNYGVIENPGKFGEIGPQEFIEAKPVVGGGALRTGRTTEAWITEEQGQAVKDFVSGGGAFYSYHNNAFVSRSSKNYRDVQGGYGLNHPPLRPFKVRIVNKDHPITHDVKDFMVDDEQHYLVYDKDPKNILLNSENIDGLTYTAAYSDPQDPNPQLKNWGTTTVSGWAHEYGKGRVAFTAMGHTIHAMWNPEYIKMQKNAIRWLLRQA
ncbi:MAG TPA: ThuA domain-containing protein [Granulicella sp.]